MSLSRRDFLTFLIGGTLGGAVATTTGLTYYYTKLKPRNLDMRAVSQPLPADDEWLLTEADLEAFAEADRMVDSTELTMLDNTDIPGSGDFQSMRVRNLGECVSACEANSDCQAFTYARSTHALPAKRQMCWLKSEEPQTLVSELSTYVSGRR